MIKDDDNDLDIDNDTDSDSSMQKSKMQFLVYQKKKEVMNSIIIILKMRYIFDYITDIKF